MPLVQQPQDQQPLLQQYAPSQQQYQANSDSIKIQNTGRLNDVNSNQVLKNQKENYGKTGNMNKN